jgi:hypothetical protein
MTTDDGPSQLPKPIRCVFFAFRGVDPLFERSVTLIDVPRVGERVHMWFTGADAIRATVRDVRWTIPRSGEPTVTIQLELSSADRRRFSRRVPLSDQPDNRSNLASD